MAYENEGYRLVWADEFDTDGRPDPDKWGYEDGFVRNREFQWYGTENARCKDGLLIIEARREQFPNPWYLPDAPPDDWQRSRTHAEYTSSALTTDGKHNWLYGRFEMRGRIDIRPGIWPAWWTLGVNGHWPGCGEIDIMEYIKGDMLANVYWASGADWKRAGEPVLKPVAHLGGAAWAEEFHVWRMDWDEEAIRLYMDGLLLNETFLRDTINPDGTNPFMQPHYMILNVAIGGDSGGDPSGTNFPARLEVDWVRVYQK